MNTLRVAKIDDQKDRVLLYNSRINYYVIAEHEDEVKINDVIEYEPVGVNFGWFIKIVSKAR